MKLDIANAEAEENKPPLHEAIYQKLREQLEKGVFHPGQALSLRGLAAKYEGSVTPVRDAVWRLATEQALYLSPTRRISVPVLSNNELDELLKVRTLLETEAAVLAMPNIDKASLEIMKDADKKINKAFEESNIDDYLNNNHTFHFTLYRAANSNVLLPLIESLWVRFGPFLRHVRPNFSDVGTADDNHYKIISSIENKDAASLKEAIFADIMYTKKYFEN